MNQNRRLQKQRMLATVMGVLILILAFVVLFIQMGQEDGTGALAPAPTPDPTIRPVATATVGNTGDILIHSPILSNAKLSDGSYDFAPIFTYLAPYIKEVDYATINLELSMPGSNYQGYPTFRTPDDLVDVLLNAGFDMVTTANNHANDSGNTGMVRTTEVLKEKGLTYTGTRTTTDDKNYLVENINGINIGMVSYTHGTYLSDGRKSINGIPCTKESSKLINMFSYDRLNEFYTALETDLENMRNDGAESFVIYIHWGNEYEIDQNATQESMAQKLCDLGFDVIVGCHPHVVQPVTVLSSEVSGKSTLCVYSMGNAISNQRIEYMDDIKTGHTEDGTFITFTFTKYSDGSVVVTDAEVLPTWVHMYVTNGRKYHQIVPLDKSVSDWTESFNLTATNKGAANAQKSYDRTMAILKEGLEEWDALFFERQQQLDAKNAELTGQ
ncbi:MAG: CapA family protein [Clostridiales bacterium]|nr:CapA family protein [Clostridiales bacterium]